jgi:hypothetical protein
MQNKKRKIMDKDIKSEDADTWKGSLVQQNVLYPSFP